MAEARSGGGERALTRKHLLWETWMEHPTPRWHPLTTPHPAPRWLAGVIIKKQKNNLTHPTRSGLFRYWGMYS